MSANATPAVEAAPTSNSSAPAEQVSKGHPAGLYRLFTTEMWERFSYYGMRALLVLYLVQYLGWQPGQASTVYKWYTSLVYLTPLFGGMLADRFLGLRTSILIGGLLMAAGQFLLFFEPMPIFYTALALLIAGNGFFKPNISTLVGKMYKQGDPRRDGAFTIFYMGINLGAFFAPIVCGTLAAQFGFRYGFAIAGVGMVLGVITFVVSQRRIIADVEAAGNRLKGGKDKVAEEHAPEPDEALPRAGGAARVVSASFPIYLLVNAVALPAYYFWLWKHGEAKTADLVMPVAFGLVFAWMGVTLMRIKGASRDKSIVIFVLFIFSVLFWMAFEQAGNALNLWAEFHTDRKIGSFTYPAAWWQAVNAAGIFILGPLFAWLWMYLHKKGKEPSTPVKMLIAMVMMALSFVAMRMGAQAEDKVVTRQAIAAIPDGVDISKVHAGRLTFDASKKELEVHGVLPRYVTNDLLKKTSSKEWSKEVGTLEELTLRATDKAPVTKELTALPAGFIFPFDAEESKALGVTFDEAKKTLTFTTAAKTPTRDTLIAAGAPPSWRDPLWELEKKSQVARVSGIWLFLSYLLATLGELCLSPVGLSMVTKLAPVRFASVFMGVWLLSSSVAQYAGGSIGEQWGIITPTKYFDLFVMTSIVGGVILAVLVMPLRKLMHNVR